MATKKLSEYTSPSDIVSADRIAGLESDGSGGFSNRVFTPDQVADYTGDGPNTSQDHTSGATVTIALGKKVLYINPASVLAALTITLPAAPRNNQVVSIPFGGTIVAGDPVVTSLTVAPNSGQTILDADPPTAGISGDQLMYRYKSGNTKWYRIKTGDGSSPGSSSGSAVTPVPLADGPTTEWDFTDGTDAYWEVGGNNTLDIINLPVAEDAFLWLNIVIGVGGATPTFPVAPEEEFVGYVAPSTGLGDRHKIGFHWDCTQGLLFLVDIKSFVPAVVPAVPAFLTWTTIGADMEQYNSNKGMRKVAGGQNNWNLPSTAACRALAVETLAVGESITVKVDVAAGATSIVLSTTTTPDFGSPSGAAFGWYSGYGIAANCSAVENNAFVGSVFGITSGDLLRMTWDAGTNKIVFEHSTTGGSSWTTIFTSVGTPTGTYYLVVQSYSTLGGFSELSIV